MTSVIDRKLAAIAEHRSQLPSGCADARRDVACARGMAHGRELAEVYEVYEVLRIGL